MTEILPRVDLPPAPDPGALVTARRSRLTRVRDLLRDEGLASGLVVRPGLIRHFTGARVAIGMLAVGPDDAWLAAPDGTVGIEEAKAVGIRSVPSPAYDRDAFVDPAASLASVAASELARWRLPGPLGAEAAYLPAAIAGAITQRTSDIGPVLDRDRRRKDEAEVVCLRRAVAVVQRALAAAATGARSGATERDLLQAMSESIHGDVGDDVQFAANIASGERSALDDPHASDRALRAGDLVLLDVYPVVEGYVADLTRTWVVGEADATARERHEALRAALAAGASEIRGGATGADIDRSVHSVLVERLGALGRSMRHHTGHGIGVFAWERPWLGGGSEDQVGPGSVICIEPGVYELGVGGLRLEGTFLLGAGGVARLDRLSDDLLELPA